MMPACNCLRMPCGESYVESRMRENRTYGSERGREPKGSPLPLWMPSVLYCFLPERRIGSFDKLRTGVRPERS